MIKVPFILKSLQGLQTQANDLFYNQGAPRPAPPTQVATPVLSPASEAFTSSLSISATCATSGAAMFYTTDGSTPSSLSTPYSGAFTISATTTVKIIATYSGLTTSNIASETYTLASVYNMYYGVSALTTLTPTQVLALSPYTAATPFTTYAMGGTYTDFFFWWIDDAMPFPSTGNGFVFPPATALTMAAGLDGFTSGPTNGYYYTALTVSGRAGKLVRSYFPLGNGSTQDVLLQ